MSSKKPRHLMLERAELGELDAKTIAELSADERAEVEALRRENAAVLETYVPTAVAEEILRRVRVAEVTAEQARRRRVRSGALFIAPVVVALGVLAVFVVSPSEYVVEGPEITRIKGDRQLSIHRKIEGRAEILRDGDQVRRGDLLQLAYSAGVDHFGLVVSIDGSGAVTMHLPQKADQSSVELDPRGSELPFSYELDAAPEYERFFLISAAEQFPADVVLEAARRLAADRSPERAKTAALKLPATFAQTSVLLRKANTP